MEDLLGDDTQDDAQTAAQLLAPGGGAAFEVREKVRVRMSVRWLGELGKVALTLIR